MSSVFGPYAEFQSTLPVGGATPSRPRSSKKWAISIHAPRGGSDIVSAIINGFLNIFQSTLPVGGATSAEYASRLEK